MQERARSLLPWAPMARIFLSHASEDKPLVRRIAHALRDAGHHAWLDEDILLGESIPEQIERELVNAGYVIFCISAEAVRSRWVQDELDRTIMRVLGAKGQLLIPVRLDDVEPPAAIQHRKWLDLFPAASFDKGMQTLLGTIEAYETRKQGKPETPPGPNNATPSASNPSVPSPAADALDERTRALSAQLLDAHERKRVLEKAGAPSEMVDREIRDLKREIRRGGQLKEGSILSGRYQLLRKLGRGGFATVWEALDTEDNERVAIKVLHSEIAGDKVRRDRFFRGAKAMEALKHEAIVRVLTPHGEDDGFHYFVMELVPGGDLRKAVLDGRVAPEDVIPLILRIGEALADAHKAGSIHRDVKPANILLTRDGKPKLTDFDLVTAGADSTGGTRTQGGLGTVLYAAPELMEQANDADARTDVYGLAMTAVFALRGKDLSYVQMLRNREGMIRRVPSSEQVAKTLLQAAAVHPEDRFATMSDFCAALQEAISPTTQPETPTEPKASPSASELTPKRPAVAHTALALVAPMRFIALPGGEFTMGSPESERYRDSDETLHKVRLSPFQIAETPVTQKQWQAVMGQNPSNSRAGIGDDLPVQNVSWLDAVTFLKKLSEREGLQPCYTINGDRIQWNRHSEGYRLPTEAEWEYACRAGTQSAYSFGDDASELERYAWSGERVDMKVHPVGSKEPNVWGLYDMHGNVWEWCWDWYAPYKSEGVQIDPQGPSDSEAPELTIVRDEPPQRTRTLRGGSAWYSARVLRCANRVRGKPSDRDGFSGLRVVRGSRRQP